MASSNTNIDSKLVEEIIQKNWETLFHVLKAEDLLDLLLKKNFLSTSQFKAISELQLPSEKKWEILDLVKKKGVEGYSLFKQCLRETGREDLVELLDDTKTELGVNQKAILMTDVVPISSDHKKGYSAVNSSNLSVEGATDSLEQRMPTTVVGVEDFNFWYQYLLKDVSTMVLRMIFDARAVPDLKSFLTNNHAKIQILIQKKIITFALEEVLQPKEQNPSSEHFDITLLFTLLRYLCHLSPPGDRVWLQPSGDSLESYITRLRQVRNDEAHRVSVLTDSTQMKDTWTKLFNILNGLSKFCGFNDLPSFIIAEKTIDEKMKRRFEDVLNHVQLGWEIKMTALSTSQSSIPLPPPPAENNNDMVDDNIISNWFKDTSKEKGRLKVLTKEEIEMFKKKCTVRLDDGAFGEVYRSDMSIPNLNMKVAMKKIEIKKQDIEKMRSITNEKLASRTMHFGIVPLLMYGSEGNQDKRTFYFITPYMENGSLYKAIENDKKAEDCDKKLLTLAIRLKILYHIACGIHFLHTPVNKFRGVVYHMDIKTLNIVLDRYYNARLIDFGLAREMAEGDNSADTTLYVNRGTKGYFPTTTFKKYTRSSDYYSFGVVILEILTGLKPVFDDGITELKDETDFTYTQTITHTYI